MRTLLLLPLLMTACAREGEPAAERPRMPPLTLSALPSAERALCVFSEEVDGPPVLAVRQDGGRLIGLVRPAGVEPVAVTTRITDDPLRPTQGVQMKGPDLTVAVAPARLPGVPVGAGGVRRPATLTAATVEGGWVTLDGVWSCVQR